MTGRQPARRRHDGARGTTLIELLVTMAVLATGFAALLTAFTQTEIAVSATSDDIWLASQAMRVTDFLSAQSLKSQYFTCGSAAEYDAELANAGLTNVSVTLVLPESAPTTHGANGTALTATPIPGGDCASGPPDYGLQAITFRVQAASGHSLVRTVFKRWD